jgi:hypothetical protein
VRGGVSDARDRVTGSANALIASDRGRRRSTSHPKLRSE